MKTLKTLRPLYFYFLSVLLQLTVFLIYQVFPINLNEDPWFELFAKKLVYHGGEPIIWSSSGDLITNSPLQMGEYYNWRPIGYSLFLSIIFLVTSSNFFLIRTLAQIFIYSFIPVIFFRICKEYFAKNSEPEFKSSICTLIFIFNPSFLVGPLQSLDTWFKALFVMITFLLILRNDKNTLLLLILSLTAIYLITPIGFVSIMLFLLFISVIKIFPWKKFLYLSLIMTAIIFLNGFRNYAAFGKFDVTNSSSGYNLWLGNNEKTLDFLKKHFGDGSTIEDKILPHFNQKFKFVADFSEYEKNKFFTEQALNFILKNPLITLESIFWKGIGFWSPLRVRTNHYSESSIKTVLSFIYQAPLILAFFISFLLFLIRKEWRYDRLKLVFMSFAIFWFLPYLIFFAMARYRTPIEFILIIFFVDILYTLAAKFRRVS